MMVSPKVIKSIFYLFVTALLWCANGDLQAAPTRPSGSYNSGNSAISQHETDVLPPAMDERLLRDIEARKYDVKILNRSASNKTYLFEDPNSSKPGVGKIILLKKDDETIMAFRVIRTEIEKKRFFAKRVHRYGAHINLEPGAQYTAVERLNELDIPTPTSPEDESDMKELSQNTPLYGAQDQLGLADQESDVPRGTRVVPVDDPKSSESDTLDDKLESNGETGARATTNRAADSGLDSEPESRSASGIPNDDGDSFDDDGGYQSSGSSLSVEEVDPLDKLKHHLSGEFGFFHALTPNGETGYYNAMGLKYAMTLGRMVLVKRKSFQDSMDLELGAFLFRIANYVELGDSYTVVPLHASLRYTLFMSESVGIHFYGGIARNQVVQTLNSSDDGLKSLNSIGPAVGGGLWFRLGPHWDARIDLGMDMIGGGLVLNF